MNDYTIVEKYQQTKDQTIAIRPYFNPSKENMGLEQYGLSLHDGVFHEESLACLEMNGVKRYVTGLNEFAPEVKLLPKDKKKAKIKEIREVVAQLEAELAANVVDPDDKDFWNKLTVMKPDNSKFWDKISLRCGNEPVFLDPMKDPYDLIKLHAINAGGFSIVAASLREARAMNNSPKFYLDTAQESLSTRTELSKLKNKALVALQLDQTLYLVFHFWLYQLIIQYQKYMKIMRNLLILKPLVQKQVQPKNLSLKLTKLDLELI